MSVYVCVCRCAVHVCGACAHECASMCACVHTSRGKTLDVLYHRLTVNKPLRAYQLWPPTPPQHWGYRCVCSTSGFFLGCWGTSSGPLLAQLVASILSHLFSPRWFLSFAHFVLEERVQPTVNGIILENSFDTVHKYDSNLFLLLFVPVFGDRPSLHSPG